MAELKSHLRLGNMLLDDPLNEPHLRFRHLAEVLDQMPVGVSIAEAPSGKLLFNNAEALRLLRLPLRAMSGFDSHTAHGAIVFEGRPADPQQSPIIRALRGEHVGPEEITYLRGDGTTVCLLVNARPVRNAAGRIVEAVATFSDVTDRKLAELRLQDAETKLQLAVDMASLGFWEWDIASNDAYFSPHWKRQIGYQDHEITNRFDEWLRRVHPEDLPMIHERIQGFLQNPAQNYQTEFRFRHRDKSYRWIQAKARLVLDEHGRPQRMIGTHLDITDHKQREEQVRHTVQHDRLTGLPNRALLLELADGWLSAAQRSGKLFAVLFIDLDEFKPINDNYGHHIGDLVLKEVAMRLKTSFRSQDIIGRLGGDEFVVLVTQLDNALGAAHAAQHAVRQLSLPYRIQDLELRTSPSIGISLFPSHGKDIASLLRNADTAMYDAKQRGKASYRFYAGSGDTIVDPGQIEQRLRIGFAHNELQLYFQPIVDMHTHRLMAVEALLRWPGTDGSFVPPDVFLPVAEQNGMMREIGGWVLREACAQHGRWRHEGLRAIDIGINLSAMEFREAGLANALASTMPRLDIDPSLLWFEISDRALTGNLDYAVDAFNELKALGMRITLDDFGAGYASLEQLSRLPLDRVKIDRSLIATLPNDRASIAVTEAVIAYGHSLGIEVIAEGLESEQVRGFLEQRHCHQAQGYFLARPMPGAEFSAWYRRAGLH
jgi:diguanylate cyclase (GGDEF)-like protein/PAS domain S-box-containing protein